jgi:hypothetical protein
MLFTLDFVCLVGATLRVRARRLTLKQYLEFQGVLVEIREGHGLSKPSLCCGQFFYLGPIDRLQKFIARAEVSI